MPEGWYKNKYFLTVAGLLVSMSVLISPFIGHMRNTRRMVMPTAILGAVAAWMWQRDKLLSILLGYLSCVYLFSRSMHALLSIVMILTCLAVYIFIIETYHRWKESTDILYDIICALALWNVVILIFQQWNIDPVFGPLVGNADITLRRGFQANPNEVSALLAISLPAFFRARRWYFIPVIGLGLVLAKSTNGIWVSVVIGAIFVWVKWLRHQPLQKRIAYSVCVLALGCAIVGPYAWKFDKFSWQLHKVNRVLVFERTVQYASAKFFGWGFGQYQFVMPVAAGWLRLDAPRREEAWNNIADQQSVMQITSVLAGATPGDSTEQVALKRKEFLANEANSTSAYHQEAHNEYLELWFAAGFPALILGLLLVVVTVKRGFRQDRLIPTLGFLSASATALFFFTAQITPLAVLWMVWMGLINRRSL